MSCERLNTIDYNSKLQKRKNLNLDINLTNIFDNNFT